MVAELRLWGKLITSPKTRLPRDKEERLTRLLGVITST